MNEHTGRTTRLLAEAVAQADAGLSVLVVAATARDAERLRGLIGRGRSNPHVCHVGQELRGRRFNRVVEDNYVNEYLRECVADHYSWLAELRLCLTPATQAQGEAQP